MEESVMHVEQLRVCFENSVSKRDEFWFDDYYRTDERVYWWHREIEYLKRRERNNERRKGKDDIPNFVNWTESPRRSEEELEDKLDADGDGRRLIVLTKIDQWLKFIPLLLFYGFVSSFILKDVSRLLVHNHAYSNHSISPKLN